ncbi:hypothetical protein B0H63DRAFT_518597 [Podospora didyma]|uniref:Sister chromatid cohesion protein DCC1 n=1 Tax=Podospora didyma TaxID=330526 RepID=A0AAE0U3M9_9PEZI|nr:hypothetical protein B0H63DRAFT_518597 [Podospora didyma]
MPPTSEAPAADAAAAAPVAIGIPLSHSPDGVGYKLIELPQELLELLEGDDPPILTISASPAAALLKTADKTYSLRQKNTSNGLTLLTPIPSSPSESSNGSGGGLRSIATVHETIELVAGAGEAAPTPVARGKWHEKFGRTR